MVEFLYWNKQLVLGDLQWFELKTKNGNKIYFRYQIESNYINS